MITKDEVDALIKDDRVKSLSLYKDFRKEAESPYFIEIIHVDGKKKKDKIDAQIYEDLNVNPTTNQSITIGLKTLK